MDDTRMHMLRVAIALDQGRTVSKATQDFWGKMRTEAQEKYVAILDQEAPFNAISDVRYHLDVIDMEENSVGEFVPFKKEITEFHEKHGAKATEERLVKAAQEAMEKSRRDSQKESKK